MKIVDDKVDLPKQQDKIVKPKFSLNFEVISQLSDAASPYIRELEIAYALHRNSISPDFLNHFVSNWPAPEGKQWLCQVLSEINKLDTPAPFSVEFVLKILALLAHFPAVREKARELLLTTNTFNPANWSCRGEAIVFDEDIIKELLASFMNPALLEACFNNAAILANIQKMDLDFLIVFIRSDCELQKKIIILQSTLVIKLKLHHLETVNRLINIPNEKLIICLQHEAFCNFVLTISIKDIEIVQKFFSTIIFSPDTQTQNIHAFLDEFVKYSKNMTTFLEHFGSDAPIVIPGDYKMCMEKKQIGIDPNRANFKSVEQFLPQALQCSHVRYSTDKSVTQDNKLFTQAVSKNWRYFISGFLLSDVFLRNILISNLPTVMNTMTKSVFLLVVDYCRWFTPEVPVASKVAAASAASISPETVTAAVAVPLRFNPAYAFFHFLKVEQKAYFDPTSILIRALRIIARNFKEGELQNFIDLIKVFIKYFYPDINKRFDMYTQCAEVEQMMDVAGKIRTAIKNQTGSGGFFSSPGEYARVINEILSLYSFSLSMFVGSYGSEDANKLIDFLRSIGEELDNLRNFVYSDEFSQICQNIRAARMQLGINDKEDFRIVLPRLLNVAVVDVVEGPRAYFLESFLSF